MRRARLVAGLALVLCACGGRTSSQAGGSSGGNSGGISADAGPPASVKRLPECGDILPVPDGDAYVGGWSVQTTAPYLVPETMCGPAPGLEYPGNRKLHVGAHWLMADVVSCECYAQCYAAGACTAPVPDPNDPVQSPWQQHTKTPVWGDYYQATAFCSWMGGRVPTAAELARAAQGDARTYGIAAVTAAAFSCETDAKPEVCSTIQVADLKAPMGLVFGVGSSSNPEDLGPFGHRDLAFGPAQWANSLCSWTDPSFCALADGTPDPDPTAPGGNRCSVQFSTELAHIAMSATIPTTVLLQTDLGVTDPSSSNYRQGYRCAFDP
jgi:Sulfatase-modifying factor enzyme 1